MNPPPRRLVTPTPGVDADGYVSVGVIARPHGVHGALRLHAWAQDGEGVVKKGLRLRLRAGGDTKSRDVEVASVSDGVVVLTGVSGREAADALRDHEVLVRRADFPAKEGGYLVDYVGAVIVDVDGNERGVIEGFTDNGAQPLASVRTGAVDTADATLVPFVPELIDRIERESRPVRVWMRLPRGMFDLDEAIPVGEESSGGGTGDELGPAGGDDVPDVQDDAVDGADPSEA